MKIFFILSSLEVGGAQTQVINLSSRLKLRGHDVMIASMTDIIELSAQIKDTGSLLESLHIQRGVPDPRGLLRAVKLLRRWHPDIVVGFMFHANILGRIAALLARVPVSISSVRTERFRSRLDSMLMRATNPLHDMTVVNSKRVADRLVQTGILTSARSITIPNGLDANRFQADPSQRVALRKEFDIGTDDFLLAAIGRRHPAKGYPDLLQSFHKTKPETIGAKLLIVGEGTRSPDLQLKSSSLGLDGHVHFAGARQDVPAILSAADCLVLSSLWEGLPNVVMEASASGIPVVATDVGGVRELLIDAEGGLVVPSNDIDALAAGMKQMACFSAEERERMGRAGQKHILKNFDLEQVTSQWEQLFESMLAQKGLRGEGP